MLQMHQRVCWKVIVVRELTRQEKKRAQEGLMLITRKKSGEVKSWLACNGKPTRGWIKDEERHRRPYLRSHYLLLA